MRGSPAVSANRAAPQIRLAAEANLAEALGGAGGRGQRSSRFGRGSVSSRARLGMVAIAVAVAAAAIGVTMAAIAAVATIAAVAVAAMAAVATVAAEQTTQQTAAAMAATAAVATVAAEAAVTIAAAATMATAAAMAGDGRGVGAQEGDADQSHKNRDSEDQSTIHPRILQTTGALRETVSDLTAALAPRAAERFAALFEFQPGRIAHRWGPSRQSLNPRLLFCTRGKLPAKNVDTPGRRVLTRRAPTGTEIPPVGKLPKKTGVARPSAIVRMSRVR